MCVDYRPLNLATRQDSFPLPNIRELLDKLHGSKWFSSFDVLRGYHNIPVEPSSIPKTAFIADDGLYGWVRMSFGLCNSPAIFRRMILTDLLGLGSICMTYCDEILA